MLLREAVKKERSVYQGLKTLFHTIHKYAREMELLEDPAYLVMFEDIFIAYTKFYDTNSEMYTYSRLAANMRTQNYRSNSASSSQSQTQHADYFGGGLTRMASVTYSQNDIDDEEVSPIFIETILEEAVMEEPEPEPESEEQTEISSEDIDSIEHYVPRTGIIDLNVTQTQCELSREASVGLRRL